MNLKDYVEMLSKYLENHPEHANKDVVTSVGELEDVFYIYGIEPSIAYIDGCLSDRYGGEWCESYDDAVECGYENIVEVVHV